MTPSRVRHPPVSLAALIAAASLLALPTSAAADLGSEVAQGQSLASSLQSAQRSCGDLHPDDFEAIGEYAMDRFIGNRAAHKAMNAHMVQMMGARGERRMHIALGYRYTGCAGAQQSGWIGPMAGMMGGSGSGGGYPRGGVGPGMMGGRGYGPMMGWGFGGSGSHGGGVSAIGAHPRPPIRRAYPETTGASPASSSRMRDWYFWRCSEAHASPWTLVAAMSCT